MRVPNRFGGMWDLAFFAVIFEICAENRVRRRKFQLGVGVGFHVFIGLGCKIGKGNRAGYGISILFPTLVSVFFTSVPSLYLVLLVF